MLNIKSSLELKAAIVFLEEQQKIQEQEIKEQLHSTMQSLHPANLVKGLFNNITSSGDNIKDNIITGALSLFTGYLSRKIFVGSSDSKIKNLFGGGIQIFISNLIAKNPDVVHNVIDTIKNTINKFRKQQEPAEAEESFSN
jgi:hypothetical protein